MEMRRCAARGTLGGLAQAGGHAPPGAPGAQERAWFKL
jgi:hypothetical protein